LTVSVNITELTLSPRVNQSASIPYDLSHVGFIGLVR